jgi:hypothetical protein
MYAKQRDELKKILLTIYNGGQTTCDGWGVRKVGPHIAIERLEWNKDSTGMILWGQANKIAWAIYPPKTGIQTLWDIILYASHTRKQSALCRNRFNIDELKECIKRNKHDRSQYDIHYL